MTDATNRLIISFQLGAGTITAEIAPRGNGGHSVRITADGMRSAAFPCPRQVSELVAAVEQAIAAQATPASPPLAQLARARR